MLPVLEDLERDGKEIQGPDNLVPRVNRGIQQSQDREGGQQGQEVKEQCINGSLVIGSKGGNEKRSQAAVSIAWIIS